MSVWLPVDQLSASVRSGQTTARQLVDKALDQIEAQSMFHAVLAVLTEQARKRADEIDKRIAGGDTVGRLAGVPFIAKDNFLVYGAETTAASNILKGFDAPYQATAVERLEAEGAICIAKANLDAFGHGASTENSDFGPTLNPHDPSRVPGGSSGGSAAAVVLDIVPFALGTDTGGSSRQPASFSGCVGFKPTYGLISRSGVVAMASSTDTVGVLARQVEDVAVVTDVLSGVDQLDSTTIDKDPNGYVLENDKVSLKSCRIGVIQEYMGEGIDPGVKHQIEQSIEKLQHAGAEIIPVSLPSLSLALAVYYIIVPAEISSNLSRYDGQRYGYSDQHANDLDSSYTLSRTKGFGKEAKRRIMIGTHVLSSGYYDAYYRQAQLVRTKLINEYNKAFEAVDFLVGPTAPTTAFKLGQNTADPLQMYLADVMTVGASLAGLPAIVVPAGASEDLPVGLQIIAPQKADRALLTVANIAQKVIV